MKPKIYFMRKILPEEEEIVKDLAYYKMFIGDNITREIVANETKDVDAISTKFQANINLFLDEEILKNAEKLKVINCCTSTFNIQTYINHGLDVKAATDLGIYVTNTPIIADSISNSFSSSFFLSTS